MRKFKSKRGYRKWLAYGHMHGVFDVPGSQKIIIKGRRHKVRHKR